MAKTNDKKPAKVKAKVKVSPPKKLKLNAAWTSLFQENERCPKTQRKTDDQLVKEMQKLFPDKRERTTITRPNMIRSIYNKGTNLFKLQGAAKVRSRRFDENGDVVEGRVVAKKEKPKPVAKVKAKVRVKAKTAPADEAQVAAAAG